MPQPLLVVGSNYKSSTSATTTILAKILVHYLVVVASLFHANDVALITDHGEAGCQKRYACCRGRMEDPGCTEVCKKCDKLWGTPTENCFIKMHNLLECDADNEDIFNNTNSGDDLDANNIDDKNVEDEDNAIIQRDNKIPGVILIHVF